MNKLFVMAQPRSGSTLVQRLINCDSDFRILGEHMGILRGISQSWYAMEGGRFDPQFLNLGGGKRHFSNGSKVEAVNDWTALRNGLTEESVLDTFRAVVEEVLKPASGCKTTGFKEIRYGLIGDHTIEMLAALFPESKFLCVYRNPADMIRSHAGSGYFPGTIDDRCSAYNHQLLAFLRASRQLGSRCWIVNYSQVTNGETGWVTFCGSVWTKKHSDVLQTRIGGTFGDYRLSEEELRIVRASCETAYSAIEKTRKEQDDAH